MISGDRKLRGCWRTSCLQRLKSQRVAEPPSPPSDTSSSGSHHGHYFQGVLDNQEWNVTALWWTRKDLLETAASLWGLYYKWQPRQPVCRVFQFPWTGYIPSFAVFLPLACYYRHGHFLACLGLHQFLREMSIITILCPVCDFSEWRRDIPSE